MYSPSVFVVGVPGAKNNAKMSAENRQKHVCINYRHELLIFLKPELSCRIKAVVSKSSTNLVWSLKRWETGESVSLKWLLLRVTLNTLSSYMAPFSSKCFKVLSRWAPVQPRIKVDRKNYRHWWSLLKFHKRVKNVDISYPSEDSRIPWRTYFSALAATLQYIMNPNR